jgi:hypothetical protein
LQLKPQDLDLSSLLLDHSTRVQRLSVKSTRTIDATTCDCDDAGAQKDADATDGKHLCCKTEVRASQSIIEERALAVAIRKNTIRPAAIFARLVVSPIRARIDLRTIITHPTVFTAASSIRLSSSMIRARISVAMLTVASSITWIANASATIESTSMITVHINAAQFTIAWSHAGRIFRRT